MLVTEKVTVNGVADAGEVPAGVRTEIVPVVAPGGTATLSDVAVRFVGTPNTPPAKLTRSAPPKPVPLTVTIAPTEPLVGEKEVIRGSIVKSRAVCVSPPAFVTPILPVVALFGTVTFSVVPPPPMTKAAACVLLPNLTDVVPVKVLPVIVMWSAALPSFGAGSPVIVGRTFNGVGLVAVPSRFVADTDAVSPLSGTVNWKLVADTDAGVTTRAPSFAVKAPFAVKFDPVTVTTSPA